MTILLEMYQYYHFYFVDEDIKGLGSDANILWCYDLNIDILSMKVMLLIIMLFFVYLFISPTSTSDPYEQQFYAQCLVVLGT